jgi:hypothetical protein
MRWKSYRHRASTRHRTRYEATARPTVASARPDIGVEYGPTEPDRRRRRIAQRWPDAGLEHLHVINALGIKAEVDAATFKPALR